MRSGVTLDIAQNAPKKMRAALGVAATDLLNHDVVVLLNVHHSVYDGSVVVELRYLFVEL